MRSIAIHTFRSLMREKILYNAFGITLLFLFIGYLASLLVWGHQYRVMLDMGVAINALSIFFVSIGIGVRFFRQEMESKTIYLFLVRPISRSVFFAGRFLGMSLFLLVNLILLSLILWMAVKVAWGSLSLAFVQSVLFVFLESLILLSASVLFSFWFRPAIVYMILIGMVFLGHNHDMIGTMKDGVSFLNHLTPNLGILQMSDRVYYEESLSATAFTNGVLYAILWFFFFYLPANAVFSRKNL